MKITIKGIREMRKQFEQTVQKLKAEQYVGMKELVEIGKFYAMASMPIKQDVPAGKTRMIELTTGRVLRTLNLPQKTIIAGEVACVTPGITPYNKWIEEGSGDEYINVWENRVYRLSSANRGKTGFMKKTKSFLQRSVQTEFKKKIYKIVNQENNFYSKK